MKRDGRAHVFVTDKLRSYAKRREAIEDRSADLDLSNLPLESCGEALT